MAIGGEMAKWQNGWQRKSIFLGSNLDSEIEQKYTHIVQVLMCF